MAEPKGGLVYVAGDTEEAKAANQAYQDALQKLTASLEARQNRFFDPTLLAIAEGMLGPTRTGSFSEALGRSAEKLRQSQEEELKQEQQIAQARLGLAERGIALAQQRQREQDYAQELQRLGFPPPAARPQPSEDQRVVASPVPMTRESRVPGLAVTTDEIDARKELPQRELAPAAGIAPPPGFENSRSFQVAPPNIGYVDPREHLKMRGKEGKLSLAEARKEVSEMQKDRYVYRDNAVFDKASGRIYYIPTGDVVEVSTSRGPQKVPKEIVRMSIELGSRDPVEAYVANLPTTAELAGREAGARAAAERVESTTLVKREIGGKTYEIPQSLAIQFDRQAAQFGPNSRQALGVVSSYLAMAGAPQAAGAAPGGVSPATGLPTTATPGVRPVEEREIENRVAQMTAEDRAKYENDQRRAILDASREATQAMSRANIFRQYADAPDAKDMFGILNNDEIRSAVARLVEQGIGATTPGGRIAVGIPDIQRILRNLRLSPEQQARYQTALMLMVEAQIKMSQYTKGAVSNYEQQLFSQAGINPEDVPGSMRIKADMITLRGQFDKEVADRLRKSNMSVEQLKDSDWYQERVKKYDNDLMQIAEGKRLNAPGSRQEPKPAGRLRWNPSTGSWE